MLASARGAYERVSAKEAHRRAQGEGAVLVDTRSADEQNRQGCREGYSSSLAAAQLLNLGFEHATDVIGGVEAWKAAGLPISDEP